MLVQRALGLGRRAATAFPRGLCAAAKPPGASAEPIPLAAAAASASGSCPGPERPKPDVEPAPPEDSPADLCNLGALPPPPPGPPPPWLAEAVAAARKRREPRSDDAREMLARWEAAGKRMSIQDLGWAMQAVARLEVADSVLPKASQRFLLEQVVVANGRWTPVALSRCFFGLRSWRGADLDRLLEALSPNVDLVSGPFTPIQISMMLTGISRCKAGEPLHGVLSAIARRIDECTDSFTGQEISHSLSGIRRSDDCEHSRRLLAALVPKIEACEKPFLANQVSGAFYALRRMSDSPESLRAMTALTAKLVGCQQPLNGQALGNVLYGLHNFSDSPELRGVFAALVPRIAEVPSEGGSSFKPHELGMAMMGLNGCAQDCAEAVAIVSALVPHAQHGEAGSYLPNHMHMVFSGLRRLGGGDGTRGIVAAMTPHVGRIAGDLPRSTLGLMRDTCRHLEGAEAKALMDEIKVPLRKMEMQNMLGLKRRGHDEDLPEGWTAHLHEDRVFYHHPEHGSRWSRPGVDLPDGWMAHFDELGRPYYHHPEYGSRWELPAPDAA